MLMELMRLKPSTQRTSVNFMGCYAGVHGLKMAHQICAADPNAVVAVVCVELCTLHFQKKQDDDNLVANAIFSDGAGAAIITGKPLRDAGYKLRGFYSEVHHAGKHDMAWQLSATGFLMTLSSYIPQLIGHGVDGLINSALEQYSVTREEIDGWAMHPGGRKILDVIQKQLALPANALDVSRSVLKDYGNMSSASILFVLEKMLEAPGKKVFGAAFGPGLTMETFLLERS
jgi:predicted naringenin-chalcone synthase